MAVTQGQSKIRLISKTTFFSYDNKAYEEYIENEHWEEFIVDENNHTRFERAAPCNFFEQSTCITTLQEKFDETEFSNICLPKCYHGSIHQQGIFVSKIQSFFIS